MTPTVNRTRVKICGLTRSEDVREAVRLGADAVGFIFWPRSPRYLDPAFAGRVIDEVPPMVARVGVFVNASPADVAAVKAATGISVIQLHGDEEASAYADCGFRVIKALPVGPGFTMAAVDGLPAEMTMLLDAFDPVRRGGTGQRIEWSVAAAAAAVISALLSDKLIAR